MKRVLCLLLIACSIHTWGQDFASKFMEQCSKENGEIQDCQSENDGETRGHHDGPEWRQR